MGMFDSVMVRCPKCATENEIQSKGGDCTMATYYEHNAPPMVLLDAIADKDYGVVTCKKCATKYCLELVRVNAWKNELTVETRISTIISVMQTMPSE